MERIVLTFGYVPTYNVQAEIFCGDSECSGTLEMNFEIINDEFLGIDNDTNIKVQGGDIWNPESKFYNKLSETISNYFGFKVSHQYLFGAYSLLLDEPNVEFDAFELIESEAGIVHNISHHMQGRIYVRYYFEEEDEIFDEKVIVSKNTFSK
jgi:hypothetical protein